MNHSLFILDINECLASVSLFVIGYKGGMVRWGQHCFCSSPSHCRDRY